MSVIGKTFDLLLLTFMDENLCVELHCLLFVTSGLNLPY